MKILALHGINLNMFGKRDPKQYGTTTLAEIDAQLQALGRELGVEVECFQTNIEGEMAGRIHRAHAEGVDRAVELAAGEIGVLHRNGAQARETRRVRAYGRGDVVVQEPRELVRRMRGLVIREHHGHGRQDLHRDAAFVALADAHGGVPAVRLDVAEVAAVDGHARTRAAAWAAGVERGDRRPAAGARLRGQIGPRRGQDVGV